MASRSAEPQSQAEGQQPRHASNHPHSLPGTLPRKVVHKSARRILWMVIVALDVSVCALLVRAGVFNPVFGLVASAMLALIAGLVEYANSQRRAVLRMTARVQQHEQDANKVAAALRVERDLAAASSASKTRFFAAASHDLRQPLHALSINATTLQLVAGRQADPVIRDLSVSINRALQRSNGLLDSLLDLSRLDSNAGELKFEAVNVGALLAAVGDQFRPSADQRGLRLEVDISELRDPSLCISTDVVLTFRMLGNVVSNAIKFTSHGEVRLSAHPDPATSPGNVGAQGLSIRVSDTGRGIEKRELERVFEEFYQVGSMSRNAEGGLGLGLSIVKRAAALLKVEVSIDSVFGEGTVVMFHFNNAAGAVSPTSGLKQPGPQFLRSAPAPLDQPAEMDAIRVLLVEDEKEICDSLQNFLPYLGYELRSASNSSEALALIAAGYSPTVLVIDQLLRGETGLLVVHRLWRVLGRIPAVMVTGDTDPATIELALASDMRIVHKPIDGMRLVQIFRDVQDAVDLSGH